MIEVRQLTKRFGAVLAVNDVTFTVHPGVVTGFLGPNGAGKSTTLRMILGLHAPTAGTATLFGQRYRDLQAPLHQVGALIDARAVHPNRTARDHLRALAASNRIPRKRVQDVLEMVGLADVAGRKAGTFSLGMGQRLGVAGALLGDPAALLLDEPVNGLDPEGILWIRGLMRDWAQQGRTVLVSSHLMSEAALTVDHLIVLGGGRLLADTAVARFITASAPPTVRVRTPEATSFAARLATAGATVHEATQDELTVSGLDSREIGRLAAEAGVLLFELTPQQPSLEEAFMALTRNSTRHTAGDEEVL